LNIIRLLLKLISTLYFIQTVIPLIDQRRVM